MMTTRFLVVLGFAVAMARAAGADQPPSGPSDATLTSEAIYLRAVRAMRDAPVPPYVTFHETVTGRNFLVTCSNDMASLKLHHGDTAGSYDVYFRTSDGKALSKSAADPKASPCPDSILVPAGAGVSAMGVPQPTASPTAAADSGMAAGPLIIAAVRVEAAKYYHIELVGRELLDGNNVYHLSLTAYREQQTHPLTDLFVDPQTFLVRRARGEASQHMIVANVQSTWVVDFERVGQYWLASSERFDATANALLIHAHLSAKIDASDFATPAELPTAFPLSAPTGTPGAKPS